MVHSFTSETSKADSELTLLDDISKVSSRASKCSFRWDLHVQRHNLKNLSSPCPLSFLSNCYQKYLIKFAHSIFKLFKVWWESASGWGGKTTYFSGITVLQCWRCRIGIIQQRGPRNQRPYWCKELQSSSVFSMHIDLLTANILFWDPWGRKVSGFVFGTCTYCWQSHWESWKIKSTFW